ncbi:hypothetical protein AWENTII_011301 [Aspergillus wentii]|nr:hypothetical protein MW887_003775 [Aspergillus wentii]
MAIGQTAFFSGATIGITASIGDDLNMNSAEITWITAGAALTSGAFILTFGKLADMFGRKKLFIGAMSGFTCAALIAGFASNAIFMDVFSGILGIFSAAIVPPAVGQLGVVYEKPSKRKNRAFACFSAGNPLGYVAGMIVSGIASYAYNWRASFWTLAVIYLIFTVLSFWVFPEDNLRHIPVDRELLKKFDYLGTFLVIVGFASFSGSFSLVGDAPHGWKTDYVIALLVIGIVLLTCFLYWQSLTAYPLMPLYVWRDRNFSLLMCIFGLGCIGFAGVTFWLALYLQTVKHESALQIAAQFLPLVVAGVLMNVICGLVLHKVSNKLLMGIGAVAFTACFLILSFMDDNYSYWAFIFPAFILLVIGSDVQYNVTNMYVMSYLPPDDQSMAGGILNTVNKLGNNIALGITTYIHTSVRNQTSSDSIKPYLSVYWFSAAATGITIFMVPFLTIKTQGVVERSDLESSQTK